MASEKRGIRINGYRIRVSDNAIWAAKSIPAAIGVLCVLALLVGGVPFVVGALMTHHGVFVAEPIIEVPYPMFTERWLRGVVGFPLFVLSVYVFRIAHIVLSKAVSWCVEVEVIEDGD